ncbi:MAG TPA: DUF1192 domain-containing protein [Stellaceae bacterium]|nr:DUF1192 domain-containing protein [Stellaceae bacterium]
MAEDADDLPRNRKAPPVNLGPMSIEELETYIAGLQAEIARARESIEEKRRHRSGADSLFKR